MIAAKPTFIRDSVTPPPAQTRWKPLRHSFLDYVFYCLEPIRYCNYFISLSDPLPL